MADDVVINQNDTIGASIATDEIGGRHFQRVKLTWGVDGTADDLSASKPMPVAVLSVALGDGDTELGKVLGSRAITSGTTRGLLMLGMRVDSPAATGTNGAAATFTFTNDWAARVSVVNGLSGIQDNTAFTIGTSQVLAAGFVVNDASISAVTENNASFARITPTGKQIVALHESEANQWQYAAVAGGLVGTGDTAAKAAAGSGLRNYVTSVDVTNSHPSIGTEVVIKDGSTVIHRGYAAPGGGGYAINFATPLKGTANTAINIAEITATATTGVLVNLRGYVGA